MNFSEFEAPGEDKYTHIIWNVFLIDKETEINEKVVEENKLGYVIAILPDEKEYDERVKVDIDHCIMKYEGHEPYLDYEVFDKQCEKIEEYRKQRKNIFVFCNNGYQRSIPFLCYYLTKYHDDEVPNVEKAIDIILPQVDPDNYSKIRNNVIENVNTLMKV